VALGIYLGIKSVDELVCWGLARHSLSQFDKVKNQTYEKKVEAFLSAAKNASEKLNYSGKSAIIYTILDILMLKNANSVQRASVARLTATPYGVCRTIAMMFAYWMNYLGIENHLILSFSEKDIIGSADLYNCYKLNDKWYRINGLDKGYFEPHQIELKFNYRWERYVIEPIDNLSFTKFQLRLRVIPYEDFFKNGNRDFKNSKLKIKDLIPVKTLVHLY